MSNVQNLFSQPSFPLPYPGQSFFGSGNIQIFARSGTYVVPPGVTRIRVRVWGAGGSGGVSQNIATQLGYAAGGGGGGGHGIKVIDTTPGTSYTVTVGTGGATAYGTGGSGVNGTAGGTSSFGTLVTCTGGGAGAAINPFVGGGTAAGGAGGTSTGGDLNYSGGAGGTATATATFYNVGNRLMAAGGGGSAGSIFGNGGAGGAANMTVNGADTIGAGGGGGVGGKGGDATATNQSPLYGAGGGTYGPARDETNASLDGEPGPGFSYPLNLSATFGPGLNQLIPAATNNPFLSTVIPAETRNQGFYLVPGSTSGFSKNAGPYADNAVNRFPGDILIGQAIRKNTGDNTSCFSAPGCGSSISTAVGAQRAIFAGPLGGGFGAASISASIAGGFGGVAAGGGGCCSYLNGMFSGGGGNGQVIVEW